MTACTRAHLCRVALLGASLLPGAAGAVQAAMPAPIAVPMSASHWQGALDYDSPGRPAITFVAHEGFPQGILVVKAGRAVLRGLTFSSGTIDYDIKPLAEDIPGIQFRRQGPEDALDAEEFYVRTFPDCRASDDCIQYAPVIHGMMFWNAYPHYQTHAFILPGWNHIQLVISGQRMNVYINGQSQPAMAVGELEGSTREGGIALRGPAAYANLDITPGATQNLPAKPAPDPTAADRGIVRAWEVGPLAPFHYGQAPTYAQVPPASDAWRNVEAERFGTVNLARMFTSSPEPPPLTWLRFHVMANHARAARAQLAWLGDAWVFVNGRLVAQGKNFYYPERERRDPDGRLSLENGSFNVPLHIGENEVVLAAHEAVHDTPTATNHYGWGVAMRFVDSQGLTFKR